MSTDTDRGRTLHRIVTDCDDLWDAMTGEDAAQWAADERSVLQSIAPLLTAAEDCLALASSYVTSHQAKTTHTHEQVRDLLNELRR